MRSNRVLVASGSTHGAAGAIARCLAEALRRHGLDVEVRDVEDVDDVSEYGALVFGDALSRGRWSTPARRFARRIRWHLTEMPVWLFSTRPVGASAADGDLPPTRAVRRTIQCLEARGHATFAEPRPGARDRSRVELGAMTIAAELIALGFHSEAQFDGGRP